MFKLYRIYGHEGHRQCAADGPQITIQYENSGKLTTIILYTAAALNSRDYVELAVDVEGGTEADCLHAAAAQISDGLLENCYHGRVWEISDPFNQTEVDLWEN